MQNPKTGSEIIKELFKEKGIIEYVVFDETTEGNIFPGNIDEVSGLILTKDGKIYSYWLNWNPNKMAPDGSKGWFTLGENEFCEADGKYHSFFKEIEKDDETYPSEENPAYIVARKKLDLPLTEEQEKILKNRFSNEKLRNS